MSPTRGLLRGVRATSLGVVGFVLALVAHVAAGGVAPGPVALLLLAALIGLAALLLTGVRLGAVGCGVSLIVMQVVLHEAFMWLGTSAATAQSGMAHQGMAHPGMSEGSPPSEMTMVAAHVAATALMAALLAYGEKALWFLAGYVRPLRWLRVGLPELPAVHPAPARTPRMARLRFADGGVGRRGPPRQALLTTI